MGLLINISYFVAAALFILGLKRMSSPVTARGGIVWAGAGMVVATLITFATPGLHNVGWIILAIAIGGGLAWYTGKKVAMTDMPQMIAIYNGMGGGAAAAIAAVELMGGEFYSRTFQVLAVVGAMIGSVAFSGSMVAFAKLQGLMKRSLVFNGQQLFNLLVFAGMLIFGFLLMGAESPSSFSILVFFGLALLFGIMMTLPIGGADMPVV
ncbi:MAG TPA: NAD(P)(+) transhydrogenase (Re/Si-specific) subunit beta, partial [Gammaproteobacteria bacterium]|nr:NAD(P)(+) transhydrogenase (Re/Si-specific) subunit beta [Gammaproteobacteria bacterium]